MARIKKQGFEFKPFSVKQRKVLTWWLDNSGVSDRDGIIADGAIRSGKTVSMALSFVVWAMTNFDGENFAMCGKTIGSFRRNVLAFLKPMLFSRGYQYSDHRTDNLLEIRRGDKVNYFYIFGGKDERSQDLIQGITLAGLLCDEVALMPESFVNQAAGRCSVDGSKYWFNCNPDRPTHWFKTEWVDKCADKRILYLHFTMDDNLSLSEKIKARYRSMFSGVFFKRYILGMWVVAEGAIYPQLADNPQRYAISKQELEPLQYIDIGVDFGGSKSAYAFVASGLTADYRVIALRSKRIPAKGVSVEQMLAMFEAFAEGVEADFGEVDYVYPDNAEQAIINSMRQKFSYSIINSVKGEIIDRIRTTDMLLSSDRFKYVEGECDSLVDALRTAVWDDKKAQDVRLDDGTSDIDTLDAFEYSWSAFIKLIIWGGETSVS